MVGWWEEEGSEGWFGLVKMRMRDVGLQSCWRSRMQKCQRVKTEKWWMGVDEEACDGEVS